MNKGIFMMMLRVRSIFFPLWLGVCLLPAIPVQALDLEGAIQQTLEPHPEILAQRKEVAARESQIREARGGYMPSVDLLAGYGYQERDPADRGFIREETDLDRSEASLSVRQMVFDGFETRHSVENQQARTRSAEHRETAVEEQIALDVIQAYLEVLKREDIEAIARESLEFHQNIYSRMEERSESGVGSRADLSQISGRLALARSNLHNASANLRDARIDFQRVVGEYPDPGELVEPSLPGVEPPPSMGKAIDRAVDRHPILQVARADIEAVDHQYEQSKSAFYPEFFLDAQKDFNRNVDGIEGRAEDLRVMLRMRYNLFSGFSDQARKQQFAHQAGKARDMRNDTRRQVEQEVKLAWVALDVTRRQVPELEKHVEDSAATKQAYLEQYDLGRRTLLDLLNTENERTSAGQSLINTRYDLIYHKYRLFQAMGELLALLDRHRT